MITSEERNGTVSEEISKKKEKEGEKKKREKPVPWNVSRDQTGMIVVSAEYRNRFLRSTTSGTDKSHLNGNSGHFFNIPPT